MCARSDQAWWRLDGIRPALALPKQSGERCAKPEELSLVLRLRLNLGGLIKEQKNRNWDDKAIEGTVGTIAGEHDLEPNWPCHDLVRPRQTHP